MDEESRRQATSIQHMTQTKSRSDRVSTQGRKRRARTNKGREAAFVSEFLSRSDRDRRARHL